MPPPRSVIWNYFSTWLQDDSKLGKCNACDKTIKCGAGSTSGLKQHLRTHHLELFHQYCRLRDEGKLARDMDSAQQQKSDDGVYGHQHAHYDEDSKTDNVMLSGNDFIKDTMHAFKELLEDEHFTNVTLVTEGIKQIKAHKVVLSSFSPFFREILVTNPHQHPLVYLRGVRHDHLQSMVDFIYLGQTKVKVEEVAEFMQVATDLQIRGLSSTQNMETSENLKNGDENIVELPRKLEEAESLEKVKDEKSNTLTIKQETSESYTACLDQSSPTHHTLDSFNPVENLEVLMSNPGLSPYYSVHPDISDPNPLLQRFPCEFPGCKYVAAQKRYLREHRQAIHEGIKYSCDMCDHRATTKSNLKKHKQLKHDLDKFFPCHQCEYTASTVGELTQHLGFCQQPITQHYQD